MSELNALRIEIKTWLEDNCPPSQRQPISSDQQVWAGRNKTFPSDDAKIWLQRCVDKGYTVPEWPTEYGGAGMSEQEAKILREEMRALNCRTPLYDQGIWMLGPALLEFGNEEQKADHLPKIARGDIRWCQGYSEPGAGSDLASLQTRAEDKGDHFLVNGSKIWTTFAAHSDWIFCLVRTDPEAKKQEGISFLLIDMEDPGVTVTPIQLISGKSEFCQTFFDNVKVPKANLVNKLNNGWSVAKGLLKHERKLMSEMGDIPRPSINVVQAAQQYSPMIDGKLADAVIRNDLVQHEMTMRALGLTHFRMFEERVHGQSDRNVGLIMKYVGTEEQKRNADIMVSLMGNRGLGWRDDEFNDDELMAMVTSMFNKTLSIAGGTNEVQLNIIAKRALGLPD
ncbi:MAG: acyl-CoA dehydrogenase family protein [Pseudomonadales bacterium]